MVRTLSAWVALRVVDSLPLTCLVATSSRAPKPPFSTIFSQTSSGKEVAASQHTSGVE